MLRETIDGNFPIALDLLASRRVDSDRSVSDHVPLARVIDQGLEELLHHNDRQIKILVDQAWRTGRCARRRSLAKGRQTGVLP
jgi:threonine dehydrogenase-like Zn-dependent dehydrogenase